MVAKRQKARMVRSQTKKQIKEVRRQPSTTTFHFRRRFRLCHGAARSSRGICPLIRCDATTTSVWRFRVVVCRQHTRLKSNLGKMLLQRRPRGWVQERVVVVCVRACVRAGSTCCCCCATLTPSRIPLRCTRLWCLSLRQRRKRMLQLPRSRQRRTQHSKQSSKRRYAVATAAAADCVREKLESDVRVLFAFVCCP